MRDPGGSDMTKTASTRLEGLDLARFLAFVGMVIVNFKVVMGAEMTSGASFLGSLLTGRAAATFVVLAGVGLGLAALKDLPKTRAVTLRRAVFLMIAGLLNMMIFEGDILHYYAVYFVFGAFLLTLGQSGLLIALLGVNVVFLAMLFTLNYEAGWNWETLEYTGFWTPTGFVRNLMFNGWHPVFPWLSFLIYGLFLSRLSLSDSKTQINLIAFGLIVYLSATWISNSLTSSISDPDLLGLVSTEPLPPMPLYILAGIGAASLVTGLCLRFSDVLAQIGVLQILMPAGRQTLTLYIAHILIGMGVLEALGLVGGQTESTAVIAALLFCAASVVYAYVWSKFYKRGPFEALMRRTAG